MNITEIGGKKRNWSHKKMRTYDEHIADLLLTINIRRIKANVMMREISRLHRNYQNLLDWLIEAMDELDELMGKKEGSKQ